MRKNSGVRHPCCSGQEVMASGRFLSTDEIAARAHVKKETPIASLCRKGSFLGIVPVKLPNGRLLWPEADFERVLTGGFLK